MMAAHCKGLMSTLNTLMMLVFSVAIMMMYGIIVAMNYAVTRKTTARPALMITWMTQGDEPWESTDRPDLHYKEV
jgi:ABC-type methionine transport system permease subunit